MHHDSVATVWIPTSYRVDNARKHLGLYEKNLINAIVDIPENMAYTHARDILPALCLLSTRVYMISILESHTNNIISTMYVLIETSLKYTRCNYQSLWDIISN